MSPVAVSADRRFHRAHVKPARRRGAWRVIVVSALKYSLLLALVAYSASRAATFARESPLLRISHIRTVGNQRLAADEIAARLGGLRGENILLADLGQWREQLLVEPWLREVSFRRSLPSTIEVAVQERQPIAIGRMGDQLYLVDERGAIIDQFRPEHAGLGLPLVDGFTKGDADTAENAARGALAARLIVALKQKPDVAARLSQVGVRDLHNATVLLSGDPTELRLGEDHFLSRVESYLSLSAALRERVPDIDYVDLRFDGRIYVRPVGRNGTGRTTSVSSGVSQVVDGGRR